MTFELADTFCSAFALLGIAFTSGKIGELVFGDKRHWWRCVCGKWVQRILRLLCWFFFLVTLAFLAIYSAAAIVAVIFDALCKAKPILAHVSAILKKVNGMSQQIATKVSTAQTELDLATGKTLAVDGQVDLAVDQIARLRAFTQDVENRLAPACRAVHNLLTGGFPAVRLVSAPFLLAVAQALFLTSITASIERIRTAEAIGTQDEGYREKTGKEKELEGEDLEDSGRDSDGKLPNPAADAAKEGGEGEGGSSSSPHPVEGGGSLRIPNDADRSPLSYAVGERGPDHTDECLADLPDPSSEGLEEGTGPLFPD
uniref:Uncharacterized protein n=1 Tax=Chromera velia CCMP2878 TaxID=1169474 RepID=A0A0G4I3K7_9ALVE|eukprot:Cvel_1765.t1-p1 / transcript=Cvel_1765.t1 / gene=Cvel_1765 / organism=Chromera_velia_CCMP2878 / gene_product=hypothetical protein / transcript_product=hypothetical protein / location=Cvel_scaffold64:109682-110620(+) / protein_length=313 / sequence_SO=supercontig / SO=protein_coding / is_pseudo=false